MIAWVVKTGKEYEKVWVVKREQRGCVKVHFCSSYFSGSFDSLPQILTAESLSVFHRNSVPILNIKKHTLILTKTK